MAESSIILYCIALYYIVLRPSILLIDDTELELIVLEHLAELLLRHCQALEGLLVLDDLCVMVRHVANGSWDSRCYCVLFNNKGWHFT